ncbi:MAG: hypothetical protein JW774_00325 [Candidatus Aureabacteria bacterium]|nr:hypothetical protein [Candidatus Auribacterota bacterium]
MGRIMVQIVLGKGLGFQMETDEKGETVYKSADGQRIEESDVIKIMQEQLDRKIKRKRTQGRVMIGGNRGRIK